MAGLSPLDRKIDAIAIGTSAGGVEALSILLPALPADFQVPVLVVLHLPRERPSLLAPIFSRKCARPVLEAEDKQPIDPGTVYFAPPDYHLLVERGPCLALSMDELVNYSRPSIDVLFESAADVYREHLLGIILTGASEDGAAGLAAIHRAGGLTIVQSPDDAQTPAMAEAALKRCPADFVLTLDQIAVLLGSLHGGLFAATSLQHRD